MTSSRPRLFAFILGLAAVVSLVAPASAQEQSRTLTGEIITGFSGYDASGDAAHSPYLGFAADLNGFFKDPRILTYDVRPTVLTGFQWAGPMSGPQSNGVSASTTILGGSFSPISLRYAHQNTPTPDIPEFGVNAQGLSRIQDIFGANWSFRLKNLPFLWAQYDTNQFTAEYPTAVGGNLDSKNTNMRFGASYTFAGFHLNSSYSDQKMDAQTLYLFTANGAPALEDMHDRDFVASVTKSLPLHSELLFDGDAHRSAYSANESSTASKYTRVSGAISTRPFERLNINGQASYFTNYADYALQQVIQNPVPGPVSPLLNLDTSAMSGGLGASFRIINGLFATGGYSVIRPLDVSAGAQLGDNDTVNGGLHYYHALFGGQFSTGYGISDSTVQFANEYHSRNQSVMASYTHTLPLKMRMTASGDVSGDHIESTYIDTIRTHGVGFDVSRQLANGWALRGRVDLRHQDHHYPARNDSDYQTLTFTASSKRLQLSASKTFDNGLAYQFGNGVIIVPGATTGIPGIPLVESSGAMFTGMAVYKVKRNFTLQGSWSTGHREVNSLNNISTTAVDARAEYRFRKIKVGTGYHNNSQQFESINTAAYHSRFYYFELRREFRLF